MEAAAAENQRVRHRKRDEQHLGLEQARRGVFHRARDEQKKPAVTAISRPAAATGVRTRDSDAAGTDRHRPRRRRSSGTIAPTSSAKPRMCAALTSG